MDDLELLPAERACERLIHQYCRVVDDGNHSLLAELFTEHGLFDNRDMRLEGRAQIRRVFTEREAVRELRTRHDRTNILADVTSPMEASGVIYRSPYRRRGPVDWTFPVPWTLARPRRQLPRLVCTGGGDVAHR